MPYLEEGLREQLSKAWYEATGLLFFFEELLLLKSFLRFFFLLHRLQSSLKFGPQINTRLLIICSMLFSDALRLMWYPGYHSCFIR